MKKYLVLSMFGCRGKVQDGTGAEVQAADPSTAAKTATGLDNFKAKEIAGATNSWLVSSEAKPGYFDTFIVVAR